MKKNLILFAVIVFSLSLYAFKGIKLGAITGQCMPVEAVNTVMLISGVDTVRVAPVQGVFIFKNLKQGVYSLIIKANAPYKDFPLKNVGVKDSSTTSVGKIIIQQ